MGFGANGGAGIFLDLSSAFDVCTPVDYPAGALPRADGRILFPGQVATGRGGVGLYADR